MRPLPVSAADVVGSADRVETSQESRGLQPCAGLLAVSGCLGSLRRGWQLEKLADAAHHRALLIGCQLGENRQGECLVGSLFGDWQSSFAASDVAEALLQVERDWIVDLAGNTSFAEVGPQRVAVAFTHADHILVPDVASTGFVGRHDNLPVEASASEEFCIRGSVGLPLAGPGVEVRQFHPQDRGLD